MVRRWAREAIHHIRCGRHSEIPTCCNLVYSLVLQRTIHGWRHRIREWCVSYVADGDPAPSPPFSGPNFIPCPVHRLLRIPYRELERCPEDCREWPENWWKRS